MKEEIVRTLDQALIEILDKTVKGVEKGAEFLQAELPDVIKQLLLWNWVESFVYFCIAIIAFGLTFFMFKKAVDSTKVEDYEFIEYDFVTAKGWRTIAYCLLSIIFFITFCVNLNINWIKIWLAPKVWLIEYAASLVK